jgi:hypothetical protein
VVVAEKSAGCIINMIEDTFIKIIHIYIKILSMSVTSRYVDVRQIYMIKVAVLFFPCCSFRYCSDVA